MPPKPPIRIPIKHAPAARSRPAPTKFPKPASQSTPNSQRAPPLPQAPWYQNRTLRSVTRYGGYYILFICGGLWFRDHYIWCTRVQGASMAPTINPTVHETGAKDWIIVRPYLRKGSKKGSNEEDEWGIKRGDVVTFWKPHRPEQMGIKRVVAVEGDVVYPKTGVYASLLEGGVGAKLEGMPDGLPDEDVDSIAAREKGKVVVPYGHVWVEGDNSRNSRDSREIGPISRGLVEGKAVWIWRGWGEFLRTGDRRSRGEKELGSKVVEGRAEVPAVFLE